MKSLLTLINTREASSKSEAWSRNTNMTRYYSFRIDTTKPWLSQMYIVMHDMEVNLPNVDYFIIKGRKNYSILCSREDDPLIGDLLDKNDWYQHTTREDYERVYNLMKTW